MVELAVSRLAGDASAGDLLVVGPSVGTTAAALWAPFAARSTGVEVLGWDLPGHGRSRPAEVPFSVADLAAAVRDLAAPLAAGRRAAYAGVSLGGGVGFALALDPGPFGAVAAIAAAPRFGTAEAWHERAALVRRAGTSAVVAGSAERWFAPGFTERDPATAGALLTALTDTDDESYALACEALAGFDLTGRLDATPVPLLVAPGEHDVVVPPDDVRRAAPGATFAVVAGCGHQPPAEDPGAVAALLTDFLRGSL